MISRAQKPEEVVTDKTLSAYTGLCKHKQEIYGPQQQMFKGSWRALDIAVAKYEMMSCRPVLFSWFCFSSELFSFSDKDCIFDGSMATSDPYLHPASLVTPVGKAPLSNFSANVLGLMSLAVIWLIC